MFVLHVWHISNWRKGMIFVLINQLFVFLLMLMMLIRYFFVLILSKKCCLNAKPDSFFLIVAWSRNFCRATNREKCPTEKKYFFSYGNSRVAWSEVCAKIDDKCQSRVEAFTKPLRRNEKGGKQDKGVRCARTFLCFNHGWDLIVEFA